MASVPHPPERPQSTSSLGCAMKKSGTMALTVWGYRRDDIVEIVWGLSQNEENRLKCYSLS